MNLLVLTFLFASELSSNQVWPNFRGDGTSISLAKNLPQTWSPTENRAWTLTLPGYGQSSPVVWGNRIFLTAIDGEEKEKLYILAVELQSGKIAWKKEFPATQKGKNNPMMSRAAPTPIVDSQAVYALFESGDVIALNHSGEILWQRSLVKDYGAFENNHGVGSSPIQTEKAVVILIDHRGPSYLIALDKLTGKNLWKTERASRSSWTSPIVTKVGDQEVIVVSSNGTLDAYDTKTGKCLATLEGLVGNTIPSPTAQHDLIVIGAGENRMKPDGVASAKSNCCVRLTLKENKPTFETLWQGKKIISQHASPLIYQGHAYFVTKSGLVVCVDLKTGEEKYSERLDSLCWATPIAVGDLIYFLGKDGVTTVLKAGPKYEPVATNRLWNIEDYNKRLNEAKQKAEQSLPKPKEGTGPGGGPPLPKEEREAIRYSAVGDVVYGAAVVEGHFLIRTGTELHCLRKNPSNK